MPTTTDATPAARWDLPLELLERGQANTLRLRLYRSGAPVVPSTVTVSVYDGSDAAIVDEETATIGDGESTYTVAGATTTDLPLGSAYRVVWTADGRTYDIPAALCRRLVYPTITDIDVRRRWPYLDAGNRGTLTATSTWQGLIDDAWLTIQHRLIEAGRRPWLVLSPSSLREPHLLLAGARIHDALASRGNPVMQDRAMQLHAQWEASWGRVSMDYDEDGDGRVDDSERRLAAESSVWLGGAPSYDRWSYGRRRR